MQGFTLIELLMVISIIGLLAGVLVPNLLTVKRHSNDGAAVAYLRHCVTALEAVRDSVNQTLPQVTSCEDPLLKESPPSRPASVVSTGVVINGERDSYLITLTSVTGKVFRHDGSTVLAGS